MLIAETLKKSILQAAIQGKLTEQLPSDGSAKDLLAKIKAEKQKLTAEGKIKKEKPLAPITDDEKPFEIPENWEWVKFGDIAYKITDGTHSTPKYQNSGVPFLSVKDMSNGYLSFENTKYVSIEEHKKLYERCNPEKGDLLITKVGTTGIPVIVDTDKAFSLFVSVALLKANWKLIDIKFWRYAIYSPLVQDQIEENTRGVGNKNWVLDAIFNTVFPLPPLSEQKRIVERVEELFAEIEKLEKDEKQLEELQKAFPTKLKNSLLQAAMQGKLTEQLPSDGNAKKLLAKIKAEKQKLIAEGKIKKEKPLAPITDDEKQFEIPENWEWVRFGELGNIIRGNGIKRDETVIKGFPCVRYGEIYTFYNIKFSMTKSFVSGELFGRSKQLKYGDVMFTLTGENKPDIAKAVAYLGENSVAISGDMAFIENHCCEPLFIVYLMATPFLISQKIATATGDMIVHISVDKVRNFLIPLPPIAEQRRIVEKLEELLPLCEDLAE